MERVTIVLLDAAGLVLVCVVLMLVAFEIVRYRRGESLLSREQLRLRCLGALLLSILIAQVLAGLACVRYTPDPAGANPSAAAFFVGYWFVCGVLTMVLLAIVRLDFVLLARRRLEEERRLVREQLSPSSDPAKRTSDGSVGLDDLMMTNGSTPKP